jgi:hypothetical protein
MQAYHTTNSVSSGGYSDNPVGKMRSRRGDMPRESTAYTRLCSELHSIADALHSSVFQVSHRALARAIGCSASRIPAFMARLEQRGLIDREPFKNCYMLDVTPLIDQGGAVAAGGDRSGVIDQGVGVIDQGGAVAAGGVVFCVFF